MFGFKLIRNSDIEKLDNNINGLIQYIESNGGFVNEHNTFETNGNNKEILKHWNMFRNLSKNYYNIIKRIKR